jgi:hypothetical protein
MHDKYPPKRVPSPTRMNKPHVASASVSLMELMVPWTLSAGGNREPLKDRILGDDDVAGDAVVPG